MRRLMVSVLLAAGFAAGQSQLYLDLRGDWRQSPKDDPSLALAAPDLDDSQWPVIRLPLTRWFRGDRSLWLRKSADLPPGIDRSRIVLTLGVLRERYAVYVNGQRIGLVGDFNSHAAEHLTQARSFPVPSNLIGGAGRLQIAVLIGAAPGSPFAFHPPDYGPYLLTDRDLAPPQPGAEGLALWQRRFTPTLIAGTVYGILALLMLLAWLGDRPRREILSLALLLSAHAFYSYYIFFAIHPEATPWSEIGLTGLQRFARSATWALLTSFTIVAMGFRARWVHVGLFLVWLCRFLIDSPYQAGAYSWVGMIFAMIALGVLVFGWWRWERTKTSPRPDLLAGVLLLVVLERLVTSIALSVNRSDPSQQYLEWGGFYFVTGDMFTLALSALMVALLVRQVATDRQDQQRLRGEIDAAQMAQQMLVGQQASVEASGFLIDPVYQPALEVGGDLYQILERPGDRTLVLLGDVSGKGLKAAMMATLACGAMQHDDSASPAAVLGALNRTLSRRPAGGFITCCCLLLHPDGRVEIANAGHLSPYVNGREVEVEAGLPLGVVPDVTYSDCTIVLVPGEQLTVVSDGVVEAENVKRELFGFERTREISGKPAAEIAAAAKAWGQTDDITVVTVLRVS